MGGDRGHLLGSGSGERGRRRERAGDGNQMSFIPWRQRDAFFGQQLPVPHTPYGGARGRGAGERRGPGQLRLPTMVVVMVTGHPSKGRLKGPIVPEAGCPGCACFWETPLNTSRLREGWGPWLRRPRESQAGTAGRGSRRSRDSARARTDPSHAGVRRSAGDTCARAHTHTRRWGW